MKYPSIVDQLLSPEISMDRKSCSGPRPFRVEYPYGLPGDSFRGISKSYNATCVAYHRGVDPNELRKVTIQGNGYRYGPGDPQYQELVDSMRENGFQCGPGQRIIIHVDKDTSWVAEGNHRLRAALEVGVEAVEVEVRYLNDVDAHYHLIPFNLDEMPPRSVISD